MAGSQARTRTLVEFILILALIPAVYSHYDTTLKEFLPHIFLRHLTVSRHKPFCVVFKETGTGSKLEKSVHDIWKKGGNADNYTSWELGSFNLNKTTLPPRKTAPEKLPAVRCYLGETSEYEYKGKKNKSGLRDWLTQLSALHQEQNQEVTQQLLQELMSQYHIILLTFPDGPRHHQVEDMVHELADSLYSCKALAIHLNSPDAAHFRQKFGVTRYPSVVVIHIHQEGAYNTDFRVFSGLDVNRKTLGLYVHAKAMDVPMLNVETMGELLSTEETEDWQFKPVLVCFYDQHRGDVFGYLDAFNWTVAQFREDGVNLRYGLVDISMNFITSLIVSYVSGVSMRKIPFLSVFYKDKTGAVKHSEMYIDRPFPWVIDKPLDEIGHGVADIIGLMSYEPPWGVLTLEQYSNINEGPNGSLCTPWSHNKTDNLPKPVKTKVKTTKVIKKQDRAKHWHDQFDTDRLETKLSKYESIPLLTLETWTDIVEKSHAPRHIFYRAGKWAGEVTKVSLVVFIMSDCGNCQRKKETFEEIYKAVSHIDGGAMYHVNCTAENVLCKKHKIQGFPIISAFRGLGWMGTSSCLSASSQKQFKKYVRLDYHGPITTNLVMEWFSVVADNAITNLKHEKTSKIKMENKNVRLMASVLPISALGHDVSSSESIPHKFDYKCYRLMCERLYNVLDCYSQYSSKLPASAYDPEDVEFYISKILLQRKDGVKAFIMEHGKSLLDTMEQKGNSDLHKFHTPHSYDFDPSQRCETDPASCTDAMVDFILDHSRMPVTAITSDIFHTTTSSQRAENLPILIALVHPENITAKATFLKTLTAVAYEFYNQIVIMTLDTNQYTYWATSFVPREYGKLRAFKSRDPDPYKMYKYPRLCIVRKDDHDHAAFYPPYKRSRRMDDFKESNIVQFVKAYLDKPRSLIIETEKF